MLEQIDFQLLYMLAEAEKTGNPISTWFLASQNAKTSAERNKLDGLYRYHLELLSNMKLVKKRTYHKGKQTLTSYILNPKRFACQNGALFILSDPITIIACPRLTECPSNCQISIRKRKDTYVISGCELLEKAPETLKQQIYRCLKTTKLEKTEKTEEPITATSP